MDDLYIDKDIPVVENQKCEEDNAPQYVKDIFEWLEVLVTAMISVVIIFSFLFRIATIDGESMENTLIHGQKIIITNLFYEPDRKSVV